MAKILIVEDDVDIHDILKTLLDNENYTTLSAYSGTEALLILDKEPVDLVLLDLMLPGLNGEEIIEKYNHLPIIVLSAKVSSKDKVNALLKGANDYMTKPFDKEELLTRIKVQLRSNKTNQNLEFRDIKLLVNRHILLVKGNSINLTKTEYAIMKQLLLNPHEVVTKSKLLDLISLDTEDCNAESLRVHISNLRKKMRQYTDREYVESVWGIGFKIKE